MIEGWNEGFIAGANHKNVELLKTYFEASNLDTAAWQKCGTMGVPVNEVAETTVDDTFRVVEAINMSSGLNGITYDDVAKTLTFTTTEETTLMQIHLFAQYLGSPKTYEFAIYNNGAPTLLVVSDKAVPGIGVAPILEFPAGTHVLDIRQRSSDGGTVLTINHIGLSLNRLI